MRYLAHIAEDGRVQTVAEHLRGTGALAAGFASAFGGEEDAYLAGILHDIGKYTPGFQARLQGGAVVDHATAGAVEARALRNLPVALNVINLTRCASRNQKATDLMPWVESVPEAAEVSTMARLYASILPDIRVHNPQKLLASTRSARICSFS